MRRGVVLLMGPTGAGKSALALDLVRCFPLEIISVDSALVYRGMDIGTAKPAAAIRARVPHHLIDIRDPARRAIQRASSCAMRGGRCCGIWSLRPPTAPGGRHHAVFSRPDRRASPNCRRPMPTVRAGHRRARRRPAAGSGCMPNSARVDPRAAARIHVNDPQRIQRALEVYRSDRQHHHTAATIAAVASGGCRGGGDRMGRRPTAQCCISASRSVSSTMLAEGLLDEVRGLHRAWRPQALNILRCALSDTGNYGHIWMEVSAGILAIGRAVAATRQLAKRQCTWLRRRPHARWFDSTHPDVAAGVKCALNESVFAGWS